MLKALEKAAKELKENPWKIFHFLNEMWMKKAFDTIFFFNII